MAEYYIKCNEHFLRVWEKLLTFMNIFLNAWTIFANYMKLYKNMCKRIIKTELIMFLKLWQKYERILPEIYWYEPRENKIKTKKIPCLFGIHIQGIHLSYEEVIMKSRR